MLSMLPTGSTSFLYPPPPPPGVAAGPPQPIHPDHVHFRSASMPESVYIHRVSQLTHQNPPPQPPKQYYHPVKPVQTRRPQPTNLRRSATNAGDFASRRHVHPAAWGSTADLSGLAARSRTNIAALGLPQPPPQRRNVARATSFYHQARPQPLAFAPTLPIAPPGRLRPQAKDVSKPLHVDCSIEYDLGVQPKIPKDSAPLLIIHPDYQTRLKQDRFHPYAQESNVPGPQFRTPNNVVRFDKNLTRSAPQHPVSRGLARHQSFAVGSTFQPPYDKRKHIAKSSHNLTKKRIEESKEFHVSMPDISMDDEDDEELTRYHELAKMRQKAATTVKKQPRNQVKRGVSMASSLQPLAAVSFQKNGGHPKARINLTSKLEAARRQNGDSGVNLDLTSKRSNPSPLNYSFEFKELSENDSAGFDSFSGGKPVNVHPVRHLAAGTSATFCDSGLGTPSSLIDSGATPEPRSATSNSTTSSFANSLTRWKSSVSDLVNGFLCCAQRNCHNLSPTLRPTPLRQDVEPVRRAAVTVATSQPPFVAPLQQDQELYRPVTKDVWNIACNFGSSGGSSTSGISSNNSKQSYGFASPEKQRKRAMAASSTGSSFLATPLDHHHHEDQSSAASSTSSRGHPQYCQIKSYRFPHYITQPTTAIHI